MDHSVDHAELVGFLSSFYDEACDLRSGWLRRWIDHFEVLFGADVASVSSLRNHRLLLVISGPILRECLCHRVFAVEPLQAAVE